MGTPQVQADTPGIQEIYTRDHGIIKVDGKSFMDGGLHVVKCPNGTYMHASGLPIKDEKELILAFGPNKDELAKALEWFHRRHDFVENQIRPIGFNSDNVPVFADGEVADFADLYAFFRPGPILSAAIVALQQHLDRQKGRKPAQTGAKPEAKPAEVAAKPASPQSKKPGKKAAKTTKKAKSGPKEAAAPAQV